MFLRRAAPLARGGPWRGLNAVGNSLFPRGKIMRNKSLVATAMALAMGIAIVLLGTNLPLRPATVAAQDVGATARSEISIDSGAPGCIFGVSRSPDDQRGKVQFAWANKLKPATYPARLRAVTLGLNRVGPLGSEVLPEQPYRVVVYLDPEDDGPNQGQLPDATFMARARGRESPLTFNLAVPLTITSGSFVVGVVDEFRIADLPALYDVPGKSIPPGSESYFSNDAGEHWFRVSDAPFTGTSPCSAPGSFIIRATVDNDTADPLQITKIKDPAAVEPWGVGIVNGLALVTNYVSDNLTVVRLDGNSISNIPLGDGPGGTADGPFGIAGPVTPPGVAAQSRMYITLFGSNTIPSKEFPIDYASVGQGRVAVLTQTGGGPFAPSATINVGKGPGFPAIATAAGKTKLYVPCGGANRVDVIDTATNTVIAQIAVGSKPSSCAVLDSGAKVYVTNFGDGTISVIDPKIDQKIKDIPAPPAPRILPFGPPPQPIPVILLTNPWQAVVSPTNGYLYVTYWGNSDDASPNGAIAVFDTCTDTFLRATLDDQGRGTAPGSAGASGLPAPTGPLVRDAATGKTLEAGGGGGGPFAIASLGLTFFPLVFTNDGAGVAGMLDSRIDQVVSVPPAGLNMCAKPRGVALGPFPTSPPQGTTGTQVNIAVPGRLAVVACGQPDNFLLRFTLPPAQIEPIAGLPTVDSVEISDVVRLVGSGFVAGDHIEVQDLSTGACIAFNKPVKIKRAGTVLLQRGFLQDGRMPSQIPNRVIRLIHRDGTVRWVNPSD